ncbi:MAG: hypothetical protein QOI80_988 [Solirubrobacteraceae bacterium]|nr:hypothetical protein [Solirubrobacteraceae bacterium]
MRRLALPILLLLVLAAPAQALPGARISSTDYLPAADYPGLQHQHYEFGPVKINPGQNAIDIDVNQLKPAVPGYITRFKPDLVYADDHSTPRVDVIHLHHGVWLIDGYPTFAAGEEKTVALMPQGYGYHTDPSSAWLMNHMIHNLTPDPTSVYITYDIDFVPDSEPAAADITPVKPLWMDVAGISPYPVFDAQRGRGHGGKFTFPADARGAQKRKVGFAQTYTAQQDMTLVSTAGHLHPGGLYNDLAASRDGQTRQLFRSEAKYFEPAGAVSWDVAMTGTQPDWRIAVKAGDQLSTTVTYDTRRASWYESMGIMVAFYADGIRPEAVDPFAADVPTRGLLTHGHLPENDQHGGQPLGLPNPLAALSGARTRKVGIRDFVYQRGDLALTGAAGRPPVVRRGRRLKFTNFDAVKGQDAHQAVYHTITACRAPCNRTAGIAYPLANAAPRRMFDSGELGYGPSLGSLPLTPAAQRNTWRTPRDLPTGTYAYFCRVHPFMRGAFRVKR